MPRKTSIISPISFIDRLINKNQLGQPFTLIDRQREILRLAFAFDKDGRRPWDTILYSCIREKRRDHAQRRFNSVVDSRGRSELPTSSGIAYSGIVNPSGGRHDASTVAMDTVEEMALSWMR